MRILKFGGTSVFQLHRVLDIVREYFDDGVCVVVSAVSNTTDLLRSGEIDAVRRLYIRWAKSIENVAYTIHAFWDHVEYLLRLPSSEKRNDLIMSAGERCAAYVLDVAIQENIGPSLFYDSISVAGPHTNAKIVSVWGDAFLAKKKCVVVPGFYGYDHQDAVVKTIGKSGSDITAAAMARALNATEVVIYTDVAGIFTADPRVVPGAKWIPEMNQWDAIELGYAGGNVLHPRTVAFLLNTDIDLFVRHVERDEGGTRVTKHTEERCVALATVNDQIMVTVQEEHMWGIPGVASELFDHLAIRGISVTLITQSCTETSISFAIEESHVDALVDVESIVDIQKIGILTLVGSNMKHTVGVAARLFTILAENRINVVAISQGSTERSISVVVSRYDLVKALRTVHDGMVG